MTCLGDRKFCSSSSSSSCSSAFFCSMCFVPSEMGSCRPGSFMAGGSTASPSTRVRYTVISSDNPSDPLLIPFPFPFYFFLSYSPLPSQPLRLSTSISASPLPNPHTLRVLLSPLQHLTPLAQIKSPLATRYSTPLFPLLLPPPLVASYPRFSSRGTPRGSVVSQSHLSYRPDAKKTRARPEEGQKHSARNHSARERVWDIQGLCSCIAT